MQEDESKKIENKIPDLYKKSWIVGAIVGLIGAGIGGYISVIRDNYLYAGIGAGIGIVIGEVIGLLINKKVSLSSLVRIEEKLNLIFGISSFLLALAGIIGFLLTGKWVGIVGFLFFGSGAVYFIIRHKIKDGDTLLAVVSLVFVAASIFIMVEERAIKVIPLFGVIFFGLGFIILLLKGRK